MLAELPLVCHFNATSQVDWFSRVSWNLALQCETDYAAMKELFSLSMRLNNLSPLDPSLQARQRFCLVGASAAALKHIKGTGTDEEAKRVAEEVLRFVEEGKRLCVSERISLQDRTMDNSLVFFHLFELEAKHKLGYQNLGICLEEIALLPAADTKVFLLITMDIRLTRDGAKSLGI